MGRPRRTECRTCGRDVDECGPLSARGKCEQCGLERVEDAVTAMFSGSGPTYDKWLANTTAGLQRAAQARSSTSSG